MRKAKLRRWGVGVVVVGLLGGPMPGCASDEAGPAASDTDVIADAATDAADAALTQAVAIRIRDTEIEISHRRFEIIGHVFWQVRAGERADGHWQ